MNYRSEVSAGWIVKHFREPVLHHEEADNRCEEHTDTYGYQKQVDGKLALKK